MPITESTALHNPYWDYARNKIACEERLNRAYQQEGFPVTIVRPSLTYDTVIPVAIGGWKEYTVIDRLKKGKKIIIHGDGTSLWTITHARDFAKGFIGLLGRQKAIGEIYQITSDEILTWNQIFQYVADAAGVELFPVHVPSEVIAHFDPVWGASLLGDKSHSVIFDNTKIKTLVPDFKTEIPYRRGCQETVDWYLQNPEFQKMNEAFSSLIDDLIGRVKRVY